jgi:hypothetical protein
MSFPGAPLRNRIGGYGSGSLKNEHRLHQTPSEATKKPTKNAIFAWKRIQFYAKNNVS